MAFRMVLLRLALAAAVIGAGACDNDDGDDTATPTTLRTTTTVRDATTTSTESTVAPDTTVAPTTTAAPTTTTARPATTTTAPRGPQTVRAGENGSTSTLNKGDTLRIELSECQSCGYEWRVTGTPHDSVMGPIRKTSQPPNNPPGQTGGSGVAIFESEAVGSGTTGLHLGYFPPGSSTPEQRYEITITVRR